jgi:hypothetical protein
MSKQGLTPKREKFAQAVASGMAQAAAYRAAFNCRKSTDKTIHEHASRLAADGKVRARIAELRAPVVAKVRYELEQAMRECDEAIALAKKTESASAMVAAVTLKSKLNGLMVEDRKNQRRPFEELTEDQLDQAIRQKAHEAGVSVH